MRTLIRDIVRVMSILICIMFIVWAESSRLNEAEKDKRWTATIKCMVTHIPMPEDYRKITGYDSIQLLCNPDGSNLSANFCFPNQWATVKTEIDSATGDRIVHFPSGGTVRYFKHIDPSRISITAAGTGLTKEEANYIDSQVP